MTPEFGPTKGKSQRTVSAKDLPALRRAREAYREMLAKAERLQATFTGIEDQVAGWLVVDELRTAFRVTGLLLDRAERLPPGQSARVSFVGLFEPSPVTLALREWLHEKDQRAACP